MAILRENTLSILLKTNHKLNKCNNERKTRDNGHRKPIRKYENTPTNVYFDKEFDKEPIKREI